VNDGYGHATGDTVLRGVARACQGAIRVTDILGRYGGEEFAGALVAAERMRAKVEALAVETAQGPLRVTISLGVAESAPEHALGPELGRADAALDRAKETGRNRVCSAEP
jgi:two-component system cell cycle response regulator